ncbi:MAG TPA: GNAT family N-acetyltransferase [Steroidobacteraceae bacterium]|nr:GNAT family N-acetyltransferase [Steroidobacteraceae bacterium]
MKIEPYAPAHLEDVVRLSLRAWAPVFDSLKQVFAPSVYDTFYPQGWRGSQDKAVRDVCASADFKVWVAIESGTAAGFVAIRYHAADKLGEIYMIAVDPDFQRRGIARAMTDFAVERMKEAGMTIAMVETGGDPGHGPARAAYARAGFDLFPVARYFKKL